MLKTIFYADLFAFKLNFLAVWESFGFTMIKLAIQLFIMAKVCVCVCACFFFLEYFLNKN